MIYFLYPITTIAFCMYIYWSKQELKSYHEVISTMSRTMDRMNVELRRINLITECFIAEMKDFKESKMYKEWKGNKSS